MGWMYFWRQKYLREAKAHDERALYLWGNITQRFPPAALYAIGRARAMRPQYWLRADAEQVVRAQAPVGANCAVIHMRNAEGSVGDGGRAHFTPAEHVVAAGGAGALAQLDAVFVMADTDSAVLNLTRTFPAVKWITIDRFRGKPARDYSDHIPSGDPKKEVAGIFADLAMASRCGGQFTYQQGSFARMVFDSMCTARGGWGVCEGVVKIKPVCDGCCRPPDYVLGEFDVRSFVAKGCKKGKNRAPRSTPCQTLRECGF